MPSELLLSLSSPDALIHLIRLLYEILGHDNAGRLFHRECTLTLNDNGWHEFQAQAQRRLDRVSQRVAPLFSTDITLIEVMTPSMVSSSNPTMDTYQSLHDWADELVDVTQSILAQLMKRAWPSSHLYHWCQLWRAYRACVHVLHSTEHSASDLEALFSGLGDAVDDIR